MHIYTGENNVARNVSSMYVGVNGVARKVLNGYVGVDGVARQFYASFVNPLNTDTPTLGDKTVYFTAYPSIKWQVQHLDDDYVYLALYPMTATTKFNSVYNSSYSGSTIAQKCTDYLNNTIPNVADYLEEVTVNGVTAKVFIPSYDQLDSEWDWPKTGTSNRICQRTGQNAPYWTSTPRGGYVYYVRENGILSDADPSLAYGFRPAVKVRYKI